MSEANDVLTGSAAPRAEQESVEQTSIQPALSGADVQEEAAEAAPAPAPEAEAAPEPAVEAVEAEEPVAEMPEAEEAAEPVAEAAPEPAEAPAEVAAPARTEKPRGGKPAAPAASSDEETHSVETTDASGQRVVRTLAVGQEVQGTVKRVSDFGAFVDIGVGRDGLVHISELSVRRIGKVTDVLKEGDQVTLWIKKLDRERNRISLTMISPGTRTMRDLQKDDVVPGTVTRLLPYGAFVDIGVGRDALLHVREMSERFVAKPEDVVKVGETLDVRIIEIQRRRGRIDLSIKGLREEPEPEPTPQGGTPSGRGGQSQAAVEPEPEPEMADPYAEVEPISAMEAAWKKAVEASGGTYKPSKKEKRDARDRRERQRQMQEEIMNRTLKQGK